MDLSRKTHACKLNLVQRLPDIFFNFLVPGKSLDKLLPYVFYLKFRYFVVVYISVFAKCM